MENMATMLNEMAGGLQQSFGAVFERVGESLSQSAQMMHMMNEMMESALLQSLAIQYEIGHAATGSDARFALRVSVENNSQIRLADVKVAIRCGASSDGQPSVDEQVIEQGLDAQATAIVDMPLASRMIGYEGSIELAIRSPGTQQSLVKTVQLRLPLLKVGRIEAVAGSPVQGAGLQVVAESVSASALRVALQVGPFDPLLTAAAGYYRLTIPDGIFDVGQVVFVVGVGQPAPGATAVSVTIAVATATTMDSSRLLEYCGVVKDEIEQLK